MSLLLAAAVLMVIVVVIYFSEALDSLSPTGLP